MHLLYERRSVPEKPSSSASPQTTGTGRLPLPILLRVPRFADDRPAPSRAVPSASAHIQSTAAVRLPDEPLAVVTSRRRQARSWWKLSGFLLLILAIVPAAAVSRDPRLLDPFIERWVAFQQGGYKVAGWSFEPVEDPMPDDGPVDAVASPNRSAWLAPEIIPIQTGEGP